MHPGVLACDEATPLRDAARTMARHRVHCLVVLHEARRDGDPGWSLLSDLAVVAAGDETVAVGRLAQHDPPSLADDAPLGRAARLMADRGAAHILVLGAASGRPVGVLSTLDVAAVAGRRDV